MTSDDPFPPCPVGLCTECRYCERVRSEWEERNEPCSAETWSWWHFTPNQVDPYWIRCTLVGPHDEHEDNGGTGLTWPVKGES